ncbi:MAG: hypothetical protein JW759_03385 [Candidatus Coatesbacteria bacterium]|nr:hypothetical protein [Candidatus Coatesbacteria bacterium]
MACFLAPAAAAMITTTARKRVSAKYHLDWLMAMLWGGVIMLAVEHIAHREVILSPPFLTAGVSEVLPEILKVGIPMTIAIVLVWAAMALVANKAAEVREKRIQTITT